MDNVNELHVIINTSPKSDFRLVTGIERYKY